MKIQHHFQEVQFHELSCSDCRKCFEREFTKKNEQNEIEPQTSDINNVSCLLISVMIILN